MAENKYLNEKKYKMGVRFLILAGILVLIIGLGLGGFLIHKGYKGIVEPDTLKSDTLKSDTLKVDTLKNSLEVKKSELESKGIKYNEFAKYSDGEEYDLKIITKVLDPSFPNYKFDEYKNNPLTKEYCDAKNSVENHSGKFINTEPTGFFNEGLTEFINIGSIMLGVFICLVSIGGSISIFTIAMRRHILAFSVQQVMPVAKEGIDEVAPTIGNAAGEIAKGIKKGMNDDENK